MSSLLIAPDDPASADVTALLQTHADFALKESPPDTCHFLDVTALKAPDITFWSARENEVLLGVVALKALDARSGEVKSMHVAQAARGKGAGRALMEHLLDEARGRGYASLWLETGNTPGFHAALALYERLGFQRCPAFGCYQETDFNVFMTLDLTASHAA
ncbi:GNAT family N-acetyltransferase [Oceanicaulis sp. MMSF_3324]|uniref:GNAT family N-acetyltransferase n=1 Tax=Oceanicaulis sp. MMSF_3324 TaxID=3046702 RepID=UPI00273ECA3C|nr:GNAT family N-acetyltransferase [Oceanicaulis sp. MMSF_3324]